MLDLVASRLWPLFASRIEDRLTADDDPRLWQTAVERIIADAEDLCRHYQGKGGLFAQIGSCSHWMSPHNKGSWFPDVRFAWPTGYGSSGFTIFGLPEFDWSVTWNRPRGDAPIWQPVERADGRRPLILRIALPARSARHVRAVAHTLWIPGSPTMPKRKLRQGYAFEKTDDQWSCVATCGSEEPYEESPPA